MRGLPLPLCLLFAAGYSWGGAWIPTARVNPVAGIKLFDPAPAKQWSGALSKLEFLDHRWAGLSRLRANSSAEVLAAASPLAQELEASPQLKALPRELKHPDLVTPQERIWFTGKLQAAQAKAVSKTQAEVEKLMDAWVRQQPNPGPDPQALRLRITELEALRGQLAAFESLDIYGKPISDALAETERKSQELRQLWLQTSLDRQTLELKAFLDDFHRDLMRENPDLFHRKMRLAAESDFNFLRAFPQLHYALLRANPHAEALRQTPVLRLAGDLHAENVEIVAHEGLRVPQINDFDESMLAPVGPELARLLASAAFLGDGREGSMRELAGQARDGYLRSLGMTFKEWAKSLLEEKSVAKAKPRDRDWPLRVGPQIPKSEFTEKLFKSARLGAKKWTIHDRRGAGLSSIGVRRYVFLSSEPYIHELKQLRSSALEFFTEEKSAESDVERSKKAWKELRRVPVKHGVLTLEEDGWLLRRREGQETGLRLKHFKSAARVLAGLAAQMHRRAGASVEELRAALEAASIDVALESARVLASLRQSLIDLLNREAWRSTPEPAPPSPAASTPPAG